MAFAEVADSQRRVELGDAGRNRIDLHHQQSRKLENHQYVKDILFHGTCVSLSVLPRGTAEKQKAGSRIMSSDETSGCPVSQFKSIYYIENK